MGVSTCGARGATCAQRTKESKPSVSTCAVLTTWCSGAKSENIGILMRQDLQDTAEAAVGSAATKSKDKKTQKHARVWVFFVPTIAPKGV